MKLVILVATLPAYRKDFFESLNARLKEHGTDLTVMHGTSFFNKAMKYDENPGYKAIPLKTVQFKFFGFDISWWQGIFKEIKKIRPEMMIIHPGPGNISLWFVHFYCYIHRIVIGEWGSGYVRPEISGFKIWLRTTVKMFFLKKVKYIITYGSRWKNELVAKGFDEKKIFVSHNTINLERILDLDFSRKFNNPSEMVRFVFVGALIPQKNLDIAIRALARLVKENYKLSYNIVGKGDIYDSLKQVVADEGMEEHIFLPGPRYGHELASYFVDADVFLLPGTGGLAVNEAMAYGLPVISTLGDGTVSDLLFEGENGFYLPDKPTMEDIYTVCKKVFSLTGERLENMGNLSRKTASEKATLWHMVSSFVSAIYLVDPKKPGKERIYSRKRKTAKG